MGVSRRADELEADDVAGAAVVDVVLADEEVPDVVDGPLAL